MSTTDPRASAAGRKDPAKPAAPEPKRAAKAARPRPQSPIVPRATVAGRALVAVVAIMTFLAGITVGTVLAVRATASTWRSDVAQEVTIQIRAGDKATTDAQVAAAVDIARRTAGVTDARVLTPEETARLLEPWLGGGLDLSDLPVPRVVVLKLDPSAGVDIARLKRTLTDRIPTASLDDHRTWSAQLGAVSDGVMVAGLGLVLLVSLATILSVVFATRAAVATNRQVVEVLHFVGARDGFIAAQFQRHFLKIGAQGGLVGGGAAAALFLVIASLPRMGLAGDGPSFLGWLYPGPLGFLGILAAVAVVALATALTSRITVYRTLRTIQ